MRKKIFLAAFTFFIISAAHAQNGAVDINSSYKPVLRNAVKINVDGTQLPADTSRPVRPYLVPAQNLFYSYAPISLKPLALAQDTNLYLGDRKFLKLGFGNFATPYVSGGISLGDGKKGLVNITGDYIQSKGHIVNQDYSLFNAKIAGSYFLPKNEFYGGLELNAHNYYLYGYDHALYHFSKDSIRQQFQNITLRAGFKNTASTGTGINYDPNLTVSVFANRDKASETDAVINLPVEKNINDRFSAKAELRADITRYTLKSTSSGISFSNNIVQATASVIYHDDMIKLHAGVTPAWDNNSYVLLPDIYGEAQVKDKNFAVQAGWTGRLVKNSYKNLAALNPYLAPLTGQVNTKETEYYGGIKASIAKHFNFSAKAGLVQCKNLPFFINDTATDSKSFLISNEKSVNDLRIHGDISYINQDKFSFTAGVTFNGYTSMKTNARAWNTLPVEATGSLRWWAFKTVLIKSDLYLFDGSNYLVSGNKAVAFSGGTDLSAGVEIKINKHFSAWADANNILNDKYQRWHNYEVYGANFLGGILLKF